MASTTEFSNWQGRAMEIDPLVTDQWHPKTILKSVQAQSAGNPHQIKPCATAF